MSTTIPVSESNTLLEGVRWATYVRLLSDVENPTRLTYDCGRLEIVSPSHRHESWKGLVADLLRIATMELGIPMKKGGATTLRRRLLGRGMEPDECFWVQSEPRVRGRFDLDFEPDPMPDLVLESEASRSLLDRLGILQSFGVPEVWRYDGVKLRILILAESGTYAESATSRCFPWLPVDEFAAHLGRYDETDETTWLVRFRDWVRVNVRR